jgi:hypothetical protein
MTWRGSTLLVWVEDVSLPPRPQGTVSAVCGAFGIGRLVRCGFVVENRVFPPPLLGNRLLSFSLTKAWVKTSRTSRTKGGFRALFRVPLELHDHGAIQRWLARNAGFDRLIMVELATITLSTSSVRAQETTAPVLVSPEVGERDSARAISASTFPTRKRPWLRGRRALPWLSQS